MEGGRRLRVDSGKSFDMSPQDIDRLIDDLVQFPMIVKPSPDEIKKIDEKLRDIRNQKM